MKSLFSKDPKQELEVVMTCLMFICFCCLLISFIQNAMLCFDLGKDDTDDFFLKVLLYWQWLYVVFLSSACFVM